MKGHVSLNARAKAFKRFRKLLYLCHSIFYRASIKQGIFIYTNRGSRGERLFALIDRSLSATNQSFGPTSSRSDVPDLFESISKLPRNALIPDDLV